MKTRKTQLGSLAGILGIGLLSFGCGPGSASTPDPAMDSSAQADSNELVVFAAASLQDLVSELAAELKREESIDVVPSFAGSNVLAQQILAAPVADLFLSADTQWVDALELEERLEPGTRRDILSNRLVVVTRSDAPWKINNLEDLATIPYRHLAIADPEAVPAGRYARAALSQANLWTELASRVVPTLDVRAALALVQSDPEVIGLVYKTDALSSDRVAIHFEIEPSLDTPITYCAAAIQGAEKLDNARRFLDFLDTDTARAIIVNHGFTALPASRLPT